MRIAFKGIAEWHIHFPLCKNCILKINGTQTAGRKIRIKFSVTYSLNLFLDAIKCRRDSLIRLRSFLSFLSIYSIRMSSFFPLIFAYAISPVMHRGEKSKIKRKKWKWRLSCCSLCGICVRAKIYSEEKTKRKQLNPFNFSWWVCVQKRSRAQTQTSGSTTSGNYVHRPWTTWRVFTALKYLFQKMNFRPIFQRKNRKRNFVRGIDEKKNSVGVSLCVLLWNWHRIFFYCKNMFTMHWLIGWTTERRFGSQWIMHVDWSKGGIVHCK